MTRRAVVDRRVPFAHRSSSTKDTGKALAHLEHQSEAQIAAVRLLVFAWFLGRQRDDYGSGRQTSNS